MTAGCFCRREQGGTFGPTLKAVSRYRVMEWGEQRSAPIPQIQCRRVSRAVSLTSSPHWRR